MVNFPLKKQSMMTMKYWDEFSLVDARMICQNNPSETSSWSCFSLAETPPATLHSLHNQVPVPSSNTGILVIRSLLLLQPQALPLSRGELRQPAQHHLSPPCFCHRPPSAWSAPVFQNCRAPWHLSLRSYLLCKAAIAELSALDILPLSF